MISRTAKKRGSAYLAKRDRFQTQRLIFFIENINVRLLYFKKIGLIRRYLSVQRSNDVKREKKKQSDQVLNQRLKNFRYSFSRAILLERPSFF